MRKTRSIGGWSSRSSGVDAHLLSDSTRGWTGKGNESGPGSRGVLHVIERGQILEDVFRVAISRNVERLLAVLVVRGDRIEVGAHGRQHFREATIVVTKRRNQVEGLGSQSKKPV